MLQNFQPSVITIRSQTIRKHFQVQSLNNTIRFVFKGDLWFNSAGTLLQLIGGVVIVFITLIGYSSFQLKFDPGLVLACLVLLPIFINLYEVLLNFLRHKLKLRFSSPFLGTTKHD